MSLETKRRRGGGYCGEHCRAHAALPCEVTERRHHFRETCSGIDERERSWRQAGEERREGGIGKRARPAVIVEHRAGRHKMRKVRCVRSVVEPRGKIGPRDPSEHAEHGRFRSRHRLTEALGNEDGRIAEHQPARAARLQCADLDPQDAPSVRSERDINVRPCGGVTALDLDAPELNRFGAVLADRDRGGRFSASHHAHARAKRRVRRHPQRARDRRRSSKRKCTTRDSAELGGRRPHVVQGRCSVAARQLIGNRYADPIDFRVGHVIGASRAAKTQRQLVKAGVDW